MRIVYYKVFVAGVAGVLLSLIGQAAQQAGSERPAAAAAFDPRDFSGHWHRESSLVTFGHVEERSLGKVRANGFGSESRC